MSSKYDPPVSEKATDNGFIVRYALKDGIDYRPNPKAIFRSSLSLYEVIKKKYLYDLNNNRIGYLLNYRLQMNWA